MAQLRKLLVLGLGLEHQCLHLHACFLQPLPDTFQVALMTLPCQFIVTQALHQFGSTRLGLVQGALVAFTAVQQLIKLFTLFVIRLTQLFKHLAELFTACHQPLAGIAATPLLFGQPRAFGSEPLIFERQLLNTLL